MNHYQRAQAREAELREAAASRRAWLRRHYQAIDVDADDIYRAAEDGADRLLCALVVAEAYTIGIAR